MNKHFIQFHVILPLGPSCVNRDDTGAPKTAVYGGAYRLRISSQSFKSAMRRSTIFNEMLGPNLSTQTQRYGGMVFAHLMTIGTSEEIAKSISKEIAEDFGKLKLEKSAKTIGQNETLVRLSPCEIAAGYAYAELRAFGKDTEKKGLKDILSLMELAVDTAMFGRMLAARTDMKVEAAVSVSHLITTHKAVAEDDYLTGMDDLSNDDEQGAAYIGSQGFGAGTYYGYISINKGLLLRNLNGDVKLAKACVEALLICAATVQPAGKSASFAHGTRASYIGVEIGNAAPCSLVSAFEVPVDKILQDNESLTDASVRALRAKRAQFENAYKIGNSIYEMDVNTGLGDLSGAVSFALSAFDDVEASLAVAAE
jgi:CRISPR system Cascade subunit CasC